MKIIIFLVICSVAIFSSHAKKVDLTETDIKQLVDGFQDIVDWAGLECNGVESYCAANEKEVKLSTCQRILKAYVCDNASYEEKAKILVDEAKKGNIYTSK